MDEKDKDGILSTGASNNIFNLRFNCPQGVSFAHNLDKLG